MQKIVREELNKIEKKVKIFIEYETNSTINAIVQKVNLKFSGFFNKLQKIEKNNFKKESTLMEVFIGNTELENLEANSFAYIKEIHEILEEAMDIKSKELINDVEKSYIRINGSLDEKGEMLNLMSLDYFIGIKKISKMWDSNLERVEKILNRELIEKQVFLNREIRKIKKASEEKDRNIRKIKIG